MKRQICGNILNQLLDVLLISILLIKIQYATPLRDSVLLLQVGVPPVVIVIVVVVIVKGKNYKLRVKNKDKDLCYCRDKNSSCKVEQILITYVLMGG